MREIDDVIFFEPRFWILDHLPVTSNIWIFKTNVMKGNGTFYSYETSPQAVTLRLISHGSGAVIMNGIRKTVKKGDMFCAIPGTSIEFCENPTDPWQWYELQFSGDETMKLVKLLGFTKKTYSLTLENPPEVMSCFRRIHDCFAQSTRSPWEVLSLLHKLIGLCTSPYENVKKNARESSMMLLIRAQDLIESMPYRRINVSELSRMLNVDRTTLRRAFRKQSGVSPIDFIMSFRIKKALEILKETEFTLSKVATLSGFANEKYFIKCFRNEIGITPGKWRYRAKELLKN